VDETGFVALADQVESWWGVHLYARIVDDSSVPRTDWYYVSVPREMLSEDRDSLLTILLHEWGHRTISPRTVRKMLLWQALILDAGVGDPGDLVNIISDVQVDAYYLDPANEWSEVYENGTRRHLELMADQLSGQLRAGHGETLAVQRLALLYDLECLAFCDATGIEHTPILPVTKKVWAILRDVNLSDDERVPAVAREVAYLYPRNTGGSAVERSIPAGFWGGCGPGVKASARDVPVLLRDLAAHGVAPSERDLVTLLGRERGVMAVDERSMNRAYELLGGALGRIPGSGRFGAVDPAGTRTWRPGDQVRELDWIRTIGTFGVSIPGVTTLRRWESPGAKTSGLVMRRGLCVIADDSSSTWGDTNRAVVGTGVGLIGAAKRWGDEIALVTFGESASGVGPGRDYTGMQRRLARCGGLSGGTRLGPALTTASRLHDGRQSVLTCILTDANIADAESDEVREGLASLTRIGQVVIFAFGLEIPQWCRGRGIIVRAIQPGVDPAREVLRQVQELRRRHTPEDPISTTAIAG
jgi:hypothetical protein